MFLSIKSPLLSLCTQILKRINRQITPTYPFASYVSAHAAAGFAANLRKDMFYHMQDYSFENIDKFSSSSLVTRLTTDVTNVQTAYQILYK